MLCDFLAEALGEDAPDDLSDAASLQFTPTTRYVAGGSARMRSGRARAPLHFLLARFTSIRKSARRANARGSEMSLLSPPSDAAR